MHIAPAFTDARNNLEKSTQKRTVQSGTGRQKLVPGTLPRTLERSLCAQKPTQKGNWPSGSEKYKKCIKTLPNIEVLRHITHLISTLNPPITFALSVAHPSKHLSTDPHTVLKPTPKAIECLLSKKFIASYSNPVPAYELILPASPPTSYLPSQSQAAHWEQDNSIVVIPPRLNSQLANCPLGCPHHKDGS
ncbi:hypothetical protein JTE90_001155 [Oedothorax gibbosus]|uniref:Uncharacterized protein n=1 Tax=Oedothorax gibbosus TaxID=931172 RepID=A0AAV6VIH4_9ARAC|nr:hypothetical protein JTE90_001155 [Oedothorax gibbosus]